MRGPISHLLTAVVVAGLLTLSSTASRAEQNFALVLGPLLKPACDQVFPGYKAENAANYAAWRNQHQASIDAWEGTEEFRSKQAASLQMLAALTPEETRELERRCTDLADAFQTGAPADPRFAAPETTWAVFHASLRNADRETALSCVVGNARRKLAQVFAVATDRDVRDMGDLMVKLDVDAPTGDTMQGAMLLRDGHVDSVMFLRLGQNWKIVEM
jgi:hypothetical protein